MSWKHWIVVCWFALNALYKVWKDGEDVEMRYAWFDALVTYPFLTWCTVTG